LIQEGFSTFFVEVIELKGSLVKDEVLELVQREADTLLALKEFASSFLFIVSWVIFAISAYLLYWAIIMPLLAIIPFLISLCSGLLCFYLSRKLDDRRKNN